MKQTKYPSKEIESKRFLYFETGLIIALSLVLIAFEWESKAPESTVVLTSNMSEVDGIDIIQTYRDIEKPKTVYSVPSFILIPDETETLFDDPIIQSLEIGENDPIPTIFTNPEPEREEIIPFYKVETQPRFRGKDFNAFSKYVLSRLIFPQEAIDMGLKGKIEVSFVIDDKGNVKDVRVVRSADPMLDNLVVNAVKSSPKWTPGKQNNMPVNVSFKLPVSFNFQ